MTEKETTQEWNQPNPLADFVASEALRNFYNSKKPKAKRGTHLTPKKKKRKK